MALISNAFCTVAEVVRKVGREAVVAWSDHDEDHVPDDDVIEDAINQATEEILTFTGLYSTTGLASSTLVNRWCVTLSCYFLSTARGNSPSEWLETEFQRVMQALQAIQDGSKTLPGVALAGFYRPTLSNLTVDQRFRRSKVRVTPANSSDNPTTLTQDQTIDAPRILD